jgi:hypothetical protein
MAPERRNQIVLAVLMVVLVGALYRAVNQSTPRPGAAQAAASVRGGRGAAAVRPIGAPDVRLEALESARSRPAGSGRNPFEYGVARPAAAPAGGPARGPRLPPPPVPAAPVAASVPPITLKFIGVVEATEKSQTYAVLRDERGVYHGREGDIVEGRYRILRIGAESIELAYVDGRGRQTIRLGS